MNKTGHGKSQTRGEVRSTENVPWVNEAWLRKYLSVPIHIKAMDPEGMHP